ncbi:interferon-inducible GTPase 5-like [Xyrichtys novacula]|uniref:Interferon-inducible GTPase 5-like n=1 Tax=Xyrichtys novacula TaxID=13765 RepID=A0AAV1GLP3_XYRNO|nr:interferon-inducible GTPase 5-like [Xyrichtys novacula]
MEVQAYQHPSFPSVTFWDLPGIGTMSYPADKYLKLVGFERFDFFIIISADRFKENDVKLAREIQRMGKKFYFVRSKIDNNIRDGERQKLDAEKTLILIKENCIHGLQKLGFQSPLVFLVSSVDLHLYDFSLLVETLEQELPDLKKEAFLLAMPNTSLEMIHKKEKAFYSKIKYFAALSAAVAAVPVPGLSIAVDIALLVSLFTRYVFGFGLDISSLKRLANYRDVPYEELKKIVISPLAAAKITSELVLKVVKQSASTAALLAAEEGARFIPVFGIPAAMILSFTTTYSALSSILDILAKDAERVFERVKP